MQPPQQSDCRNVGASIGQAVTPRGGGSRHRSADALKQSFQSLLLDWMSPGVANA
ncbi:hypothetical protein OKW38_002769 [Paraburkholderia sp. MM5496-R1]